MENINQMRQKHKKEIETLQKLCSHSEISNWMDYQWAPGHFSGRVKVCEFCGKTMEKECLKF